jgi:hypothetical protein
MCTREECKKLIEESGIIIKRKDGNRIRKELITDEIIQNLRSLTPNCRDNFLERVYWIFNNITEYPKCAKCNTTFYSTFHGLSTAYKKNAIYCSTICRNRASFDRIATNKKKLLEQQNSIPLYSKDQIIELINNHNIISQGKTQLRVKIKELEKIPRMIESIIELTANCRDNIIERLYWILNNRTNYFTCRNCGILFQPNFYGLKHGYYEDPKHCSIKCSMSNPETLLKTIETSQALYHTNHPTQAQSTKDIFKKTCQEKYGTSHPMQDAEIFKKAQSSLYNSKNMTLPSGIEITYQGYENVAITTLLENSYLEEQLILDRNLIPQIQYYFNYKPKIYFPDIYIPQENKIIEVKSTYTYKKDLEKNLAKRQACLDQGYQFEFWICSDKEVLWII